MLFLPSKFDPPRRKADCDLGYFQRERTSSTGAPGGRLSAGLLDAVLAESDQAKRADSKMAAQLEEFFGRHGGGFPGHERALAQTTEQIRMCDALRTLRADELRAALDMRDVAKLPRW